jgi:hypothetical protein
VTSTQGLWWQVRERLAAQAWSCDDTTWLCTQGGRTVGSRLAHWANLDTSDRLEVARTLQHRSEAREELTDENDIVAAWLDLRRIDAALGRAAIDLRSDVAHHVGAALLTQVVNDCTQAGAAIEVHVTGPGFRAVAASDAAGNPALVRMSWPTFVAVAAGTTDLAESTMDLSGPEAALDAFFECIDVLKTAYEY